VGNREELRDIKREAHAVRAQISGQGTTELKKFQKGPGNKGYQKTNGSPASLGIVRRAAIYKPREKTPWNKTMFRSSYHKKGLRAGSGQILKG